MVIEKGMKLRTRLENARTLKARTGEGESYQAGEMVKIGDTIGIVVEEVGENSEFVLVYDAEKIVVPKAVGQGISFNPGDNVYYDATAKKITNVAEGNTLCGKALESAGDSESELLIDLMVLG